MIMPCNAFHSIVEEVKIISDEDLYLFVCVFLYLRAKGIA